VVLAARLEHAAKSSVEPSGAVKAWSAAKFPHKTIARSATPVTLIEPRPAASPLISAALMARLEQHVAKFPVTGLLVLQDRQILFEKYRNGHRPSDAVHGFSMSKTVLAVLVGIAINEGRIRSIQDKAANYVPELAGTLFGESTIKDLLQMSTGADFTLNPQGEDGPRGGDQAVFIGALWSPDGDTLVLLKSWNKRAASSGAVFNYHGLPPLALTHVLRPGGSGFFYCFAVQ
jgi:CubicO group peptidase (beta-lactamase class C family)